MPLALRVRMGADVCAKKRSGLIHLSVDTIAHKGVCKDQVMSCFTSVAPHPDELPVCSRPKKVRPINSNNALFVYPLVVIL